MRAIRFDKVVEDLSATAAQGTFPDEMSTALRTCFIFDAQESAAKGKGDLAFCPDTLNHIVDSFDPSPFSLGERYFSHYRSQSVAACMAEPNLPLTKLQSYHLQVITNATDATPCSLSPPPNK